MSEPLVIDSHGFTAFIEDLARISGKEFLPVLIDQVGTVLDLCIARSPDPWKRLGRSKVRNLVELRIQKPGRYIGDSGSLVNAENRVPHPVPTGTLQHAHRHARWNRRCRVVHRRKSRGQAHLPAAAGHAGQ